MQQDIKLWHCAGPFAPKKRHKSWNRRWAVSIIAWPSTYVSWRVFIVCLIVYRFRWTFGPCWAHGADFVTCCAPRIWNLRCKTRQNRREWTTKKSPLQAALWDEVGGGEWSGPLLCDWGNRRIRKTIQLCCRSCKKGASFMTNAVHETLRHFQGTKHFPRDHRLRPETPGKWVLDYEGNPMRKEEVERQRERILRVPQVVRVRECPFSKDFNVDSSGAVDVILPVLAKVSALIEASRLGGSYKFVHQLRSHSILVAGRMNVDVTWTRDEVLVSALLVPCFT